jgi:hypothetical protein
MKERLVFLIVVCFINMYCLYSFGIHSFWRESISTGLSKRNRTMEPTTGKRQLYSDFSTLVKKLDHVSAGPTDRYQFEKVLSQILDIEAHERTIVDQKSLRVAFSLCWGCGGIVGGNAVLRSFFLHNQVQLL